jgi:hypothetical protein
MGAVPGLVASPSLLLAPNPTLAMYIVWKGVERVWIHLVRTGKVPFPSFWSYACYALGTSQLFYSVVLEPQHIRPSYMKFIDRVTDHKMHLLNRNILDIFGTQSSAGYQSFFPDLDINHTSRQFQETVLLWML